MCFARYRSYRSTRNQCRSESGPNRWGRKAAVGGEAQLARSHPCTLMRRHKRPRRKWMGAWALRQLLRSGKPNTDPTNRSSKLPTRDDAQAHHHARPNNINTRTINQVGRVKTTHMKACISASANTSTRYPGSQVAHYPVAQVAPTRCRWKRLQWHFCWLAPPPLDGHVLWQVPA